MRYEVRKTGLTELPNVRVFDNETGNALTAVQIADALNNQCTRIVFDESLLLESSKADFCIENGDAKEFWWVFPVPRLILAMGYCSDNHPQGFIHAMSYEQAAKEWGKLKNEGWEEQYFSEEAAGILAVD